MLTWGCVESVPGAPQRLRPPAQSTGTLADVRPLFLPTFPQGSPQPPPLYFVPNTYVLNLHK